MEGKNSGFRLRFAMLVEPFDDRLKVTKIEF